MKVWKTLSIVTAGAAVVVSTFITGMSNVPRLQAQAAPGGAANPVFEVVSIKPNKSGDGRILIGFQPGGRFTATGITLRMLIGIAYGTPSRFRTSASSAGRAG